MDKSTDKLKRFLVHCTDMHSHNMINFNQRLKSVLKPVNKLITEYYICGNINIDLLQQTAKPKVKDYSDILFSLGYIPLIIYTTRITPHREILRFNPFFLFLHWKWPDC